MLRRFISSREFDDAPLLVARDEPRRRRRRANDKWPPSTLSSMICGVSLDGNDGLSSSPLCPAVVCPLLLRDGGPLLLLLLLF